MKYWSQKQTQLLKKYVYNLSGPDTNTVSEQPRRIEPGRFRIGRIGQVFIKDYNTRMPVGIGGFGCDDLLIPGDHPLD